MGLTRREFLVGGALGIGMASLPVGLSQLYAAVNAAPTTPAAVASTHAVLNRLAYGPTPSEMVRLHTIGLAAWLEEQLHPKDADDTFCNARLAATTIRVQYPADETGAYPARKEDRPLSLLNQTTEALWPLTNNTIKRSGIERALPVDEVRIATWVRMVYSKWQLREVMVEFWHNHFNVDAGNTPRITASFPPYDTVMRRHCFGNFRTMIEDVAKSPAMLYYLNNDKSRASPANENYAREMFELHTLGADHYYNNIYNRWREVPGATEGQPIGYIDQDVYEAARAFTGWTVEDGDNTSHGSTLPDTGKFTYFDGWHDNYQKRVLGVEFDPNASPMADGKKVLDLVSAHPGTAMHLCTKLCRRLVSDDPPPELVKRAAQVWLQAVNQPDQIAQVLRSIILAPEFAATTRGKVKRPPELIASFMRATGADFTPNRPLMSTIRNMGYRHFEWPTPTGHPDIAEFWLNTNSMLGGWNLLQTLPAMRIANVDAAAQTPANVTTPRQITVYWYERLTGYVPTPPTVKALLEFLPSGSPDNPLNRADPGARNKLNQLVTLIAMLPDFQWRG